jgi:hypothetical protein
MKILAIQLNIILLLIAVSIGVSVAQDRSQSRLGGLLATKPVVEHLEKYGFGSATFVSHRDSDLSSATFGFEMCVLEVPKGNGKVRVMDLRVSKSPTELFESAFPESTIGAMTGGFFGVDARGNPIPLGLVKSDGEIISQRHPWTSGGVVAHSENRVEIVPILKFASPSRYSDIVQSKPMLVEGGRDGIRSDTGDRFDRSAIAIDSDGSLFFFVIYEPAGNAASLAEFSNLILTYRSQAGLGAIDFALAMDGGPGAHMYLPALKKHCGAGIPTYIPNALYVTK